MNHERIDQAVHNNAMWCDAVCRAHGHPGTFLDDIWFNRHTTPRFYPNAVTLMHDRSATQIASIRDLVESGWSVKDSYCALDLAPLRFRMLFEAEWLYRAAALPKPDGDTAGVRWAQIATASELAEWEKGWAGAVCARKPGLARKPRAGRRAAPRSA